MYDSQLSEKFVSDSLLFLLAFPSLFAVDQLTNDPFDIKYHHRDDFFYSHSFLLFSTTSKYGLRYDFNNF